MWRLLEAEAEAVGAAGASLEIGLLAARQRMIIREHPQLRSIAGRERAELTTPED